MNRALRCTAGLTLLELLIALAVIAIAFLALAAAQLGSLSTTANARDISNAKTFGNRMLEEARRDTLLTIKAAGGTSGSVNVDLQRAKWDEYEACPDVTTSMPTASPNGSAHCHGGSTSDSIYSASYVIGPESTPPDVDPAAGNYSELVDIRNEGLLHIRMRVDWTKGDAAKTLSFVDYVSCAEVDLRVCPEPATPSGHE